MPVIVVAILLLSTGRIMAQSQNLDYFISQALANSPLLKDYQNQVFSSSIDSQKLRASYRPQVTGISNNTIAPVIGGFGYDQVLTNLGAYTTMVNASQAFVGKKNISTQYKAFDLVSDSLKNARKLSEQDLKRTITAQYITAFGDLQQYNFNVTVNSLLRSQEVVFKRLTASNVYRQTDYLTFLVTLKQQDLQMKQLAIQFQTDYATLKYLCGIYDTTTIPIDSPAIVLQQLPDESSSVFFLHYRSDSLSLQNSIAVLNYNYKPKLSAFVNAGFSSSFLYQAYQNFGFSLGFNVSVPIYDGHLRKMQTQKINLLENTRSNYAGFFRNQYYQQVYMLKKQLASTESLITDINDQVRYAKGLIDVNGKLMETGDVKVSDFVIAINNYLGARNLLTQNTISRLQIINQLNYWNR